MNVKQPHRVRLELPDGGGVVLEPVCAFCHEDGDSILCPICDRLFCFEGCCFEVHLNARDSLDAPEAIRAFLRTPTAHALLEQAFAGAGDKTIDWRHGLTCENCNAELRDIIVELLRERVHVLPTSAEICKTP